MPSISASLIFKDQFSSQCQQLWLSLHVDARRNSSPSCVPGGTAAIKLIGTICFNSYLLFKIYFNAEILGSNRGLSFSLFPSAILFSSSPPQFFPPLPNFFLPSPIFSFLLSFYPSLFPLWVASVMFHVDIGPGNVGYTLLNKKWYQKITKTKKKTKKNE